MHKNKLHLFLLFRLFDFYAYSENLCLTLFCIISLEWSVQVHIPFKIDLSSKIRDVCSFPEAPPDLLQLCYSGPSISIDTHGYLGHLCHVQPSGPLRYHL
jgi:hypothetical protein